MLSRDTLHSGAWLESFRGLPAQMLWTRERIEASLERTLALRPDDGPVWVFAYGSLMWNPLIHFDRQASATLHGWHRSFCLHMFAGRACTERPGRMLALEPGDSAQGIALRLDPQTMHEELQLVWTREMVMGSYQPTWASIALEDGTHAHAILFAADPTQPQYAADASVRTVAPLIAAASGPQGTNEDYVFQLEAALAASHLTDAYIGQLAAEIRRITQRPTAAAA
jgi:cation transport protein ChaC